MDPTGSTDRIRPVSDAPGKAMQTLMPVRGTARQPVTYDRPWQPSDPPRTDAPTRRAVALLFPKLFWPQVPMQPPLPVLALAANLRHQGYAVLFLDERVREDAVDRIIAARGELLMVGLSAHVGTQAKNCVGVARRLKAAMPEVPIVLGGWFPSIFPDASLEESAFDVAVIGQAEATIVELAEALALGRPLSEIPGIRYREGGETRGTAKRRLEDVNCFPPIAYDLIDAERHLNSHGRLNFFTSRGCPGRCRFCGVFCVYHQGWTGLTPGRVVHDVRQLVERCPAVQGLEFIDTDFASDRERTVGIARALAESGLKVGWKCACRIYNLKDYPLDELRLLARSGCEEIEIGVESGSQRMLDIHRKQTKVEDIEPTIHRLGEAGIRARVNVILGAQGEELQDFRATFRLLQRLRRIRPRPYWSFYRYVPIPGTSMGASTWGLRQRGHDGQPPRNLDEIFEIRLPEEEQPMFWLGEEHEKRVRMAYFFYIRLGYYMDGRWGRSLRDRFYALVLAPLARLRLRSGWFRWPFERAFNRRFGPQLPAFM